MEYTLHCGDNREVLRTMADASVDSIVCDPPYELGFMGKHWDSTGIAYDVTLWAECLRVLKPGGHLIAFGGSRTYHRMAVAIEDAGFEIRDQIQWIYGSGFPKSLAVDKAIDKQRDDREQVYAVTAWMRQARDNAGLSNADIDKAFGFNGMAGHWTSSASQPSVPTLDQIPPLLDLFGLTLDDVPDDVRTLIWTLNGRKGQPGEAWYQRTVVTEKREDMFGEYEVEDVRTMVDSKKARPGMPLQQNANHQVAITAPATDLAKQWQGWGTALKPAHEPAVLARKPLTGTVADNVTTWGVGAINVDGCRVGDAGGRWPANVIFDEEAAQVLDGQSGHSVSSPSAKNRTVIDKYFKGKNSIATQNYTDSGGASRFFYVAKASKAEREAGLDCICTVKYNIDRSILGGLSWKDVSTVVVQLLQKVTSELAMLKWHIDESGENITAQYPSDSSFITSMEISRTTALKTCNLLMHSLTSESTVDANCEMASGSSHAKNVESLRAWILSITNGKMELAHGAVNVASTTLQQISESEPLQRNNVHSTVKPIALMRYLVRMVTPKGGIVLDPFTGSGSTGCAAVLEGCDFVGMDITPEYVEIAQKRIAYYAVESPLLL
jgi:DNA modification methylase